MKKIMKLYINIVIISLLATLLATVTVAAQANTEPGNLTFAQAISIALEQNHQVKIARNTAEIAENSAHIGNAGLLPSISFSATTTYLAPENNSTGTLSNTTNTAQLQLTYTLFDGLGNIYRYKRLTTGSQIADLEARHLIETTLVQVGNAYYGAASSFENLHIAGEILAISKERLNRAEKRSVYGQARTIDVLAARVDYIADKVTFTQAQYGWEEARRRLNVLLNRDINQDFVVDTGVKINTGYELEQLKTAARSGNASYLSAKERVQQSRYDVKIATAAYLPRLSLNSSYYYSNYLGGFDPSLSGLSGNFRLAASLDVNLFNGFQTAIQRANANIALDNNKLLEDQTLLNLEKDVISAYEAYRTALLVLELQEQYVEAAQLNFQRTQELYNLGQVTTTQFREAQLNLSRARTNQSAAKYSVKLKELELLRLTGQLVKN